MCGVGSSKKQAYSLLQDEFVRRLSATGREYDILRVHVCILSTWCIILEVPGRGGESGVSSIMLVYLVVHDSTSQYSVHC